jgi:hypothetical protein
MPAKREARLVSLAIYQQFLRTRERIRTLRREIDDTSRELHQRFDGFNAIIEENSGQLASEHQRP